MKWLLAQQQPFFLSESGFILRSWHIFIPGVVYVIVPWSIRVMMLPANLRNAD